MRMTAAILHAVLLSRVLSTCAQDARLEDEWRVWRSHTGAAVTAVLSSVRSGVAVLRGSNTTYTVQIQSLTPEDVKHIYSFYADENLGYDEHYPWAEKQAARRSHLAQIQAEARAEALEIKLQSAAAESARRRALCLSATPRQGDTGLIESARLIQSLGPRQGIITYTHGPDTRTALLDGPSLEGIPDDTDITLKGTYKIDGTYTYETAIGARRTILIIRKVKE